MVNLYNKPEYFKQFNNVNTLNREEILENKDKIFNVAMYRAQKYINRAYSGFDNETKKEALQSIAEDINKGILRYTEKSRETPLWAFIMKTVKEKAKFYISKYSGNEFEASSDTKRTARKVIEYQEANGLSVKDTMLHFNIKRESTYYGYLRLCGKHLSLDAADDEKKALYEKVTAKKLPNPQKSYDIKTVDDKDILEGFSCEEVNIIKMYKMVMENDERKKAWKRETIKDCKRYGITASRTAEVIKKYNAAVEEKYKKPNQGKGQ